MRYYIIAGEASGDLHASNLMKAMRALDPSVEFRCWGGDLMEAQGGKLVKHYRDLAFMGFTEVVMNLRTILNNISFCKKDILEYQPDAIILVDYPGFNLRIAEFAHDAGIKVFYYISPQVWAWKQSRVHKIKRTVDKMLVILPFEKEFYSKFNYEVEFTGHPLLDAVEERKSTMPDPDVWKRAHGLTEQPVIAVLPGSRKQEISTMLPVMMKVKAEFPDHQFVLAAAPSIPDEFYSSILGSEKIVTVRNETYPLLNAAHAAIVTSGTATLETALFNVPEVVCYKGGRISYYIARSLVKVDYISLVNLIMGKEIVAELIQDDMNVDRLQSELQSILAGPRREQMLKQFDELRKKLGGSGASAKAASVIVTEMSLVNKAK